jgi:transporter family protein
MSTGVAFCWSIVPIFYKKILSRVPAESVFLLYYVTAFFLLSCYVVFNWDNINLHTEKLNSNIIMELLIVVLSGSLIANYLYYTVLEKNDTYLVTILTAVSPLFTILIAYLYLGENISSMKWLGIIITIIGLVVTVY